MDEDKRAKYTYLFEKMISTMTDPENFVRQEFVDLLAEICELFHIAKGVTEFYKNEREEREGVGEILIDYDNGHGEKVVIAKRIVTKTKAVIKGTLYCAADEPPYSDEEIEKLDIIIRALLSFISRNRLLATVEQLAFYDEDGYPNLNYFMRHLDYLIAKGKVYNKAIILYNLRQFSVVNREIGREFGDIAMKNYYLRIKSVLDDDGSLCRMGGDNFVIVIDSERLESVIDIINGCPIVYDKDDEKRVMISAAAGIFVVPFDFEFKKPGELFEKAYIAMQYAKIEQKGTIIYNDNKMRENRKKILEMRRVFPTALENKEFKAFYQPKVDVNTGEIVGAEALCRWIRDKKVVPPMDFIPILEQNMDICKLDFFMLDTVCKDLMRWISEDKKPVRISVNMSRKHLVDADIFKHIMEIIEKNKVPHEYIEIELTETTNDAEFRDLKQLVQNLQKEGIATSVDDFGMGYSSLNLIREIPWNILKVDKSFLPVDDENSNVTNLMYKHVIAMALDMGLECVTEGVETGDQVEILKENKCRIAQGYYFDKPLKVDEFEERLKVRKYDTI